MYVDRKVIGVQIIPANFCCTEMQTCHSEH
jgi:hypothetical protein